MLIGNQTAQDLLKKIAQKLQKTPFANFFLIEGPTGVGKTTFVKSLVIEPLQKHGLVHEADILFLQDLSKLTWKFNPIKVDEEDIVDINGLNFYSLWTRQIAQRAYLKPSLKYKILLIQNMERMTLSAANAFLKLLEEPPSYLLIFSTTGSRSKLLDTIVSRAFLIKMQLVDQDEIKDFLRSKDVKWTEDQIELISELSQGSIAKALKILNEDTKELIGVVKKLKELLKLEWFYKEKIQLLEEFFKIFWVEWGLEILASMLAEIGNFSGVKNLIKIKGRNNYWLDPTNINFLLYLVLSFEKRW